MNRNEGSDSVFINCPFDPNYRPVFEAIVFAIILLGFKARCALERDSGTQERLKKIFELIRSCKYGIHDLSFMAIDSNIELPRYNMAFELGIYLGCAEYGGRMQTEKSCLILDSEPYRYRKSISDLSGRDIQAHGGNPAKAIVKVRDFLATESDRRDLPGGAFVVAEYAKIPHRPSQCVRASKSRSRGSAVSRLLRCRRSLDVSTCLILLERQASCPGGSVTRVTLGVEAAICR